MLNRIPIAWKVFIAPSAIILLMVATIIASQLTLQRQQSAFLQVVGGPFKTSTATTKLLLSIAEVHSDVMRYAQLRQRVAEGDPVLVNMARSIEEGYARIDKLFQEIKAAAKDEPDTVSNISDFLTIHRAVARRIMTSGAPSVTTISTLLAHYQQLQSYVVELASRTLANAQATEAKTSKYVKEFSDYLLAGAVALFLISVVLTFYLGRAIAKPISAMAGTLKQIVNGNFAVSVPGLERRDEIGSMARAVEVFATVSRELEARTKALSGSVAQLTALGEVGQAISSTLELETVLRTIVQHAVRLTGLDGGAIYEYDENTEQFSLQAAEKMDLALVEGVRRIPVRKGEGAIGRSAVTREPAQVADITDESYHSGRKDILIRAGYRAILAVPLVREDHLVGALQVLRRTPGAFAPEVVELLKTFATQSAMAIQNARLFREIAEKGKQLEEASQHKSQFLASMSHELRTPLNAILGFNEMMLDGLYGELPADLHDPLEEMQKSGKHLLGLINNVLDLAKIEAGRMELALSDYSAHDIVENVRATLRPLAESKGLVLGTNVPPDLPPGYGDPGRLTQCLMNLTGNSIKFTKEGRVDIGVELDGGTQLRYRVTDTGIGIALDKIDTLFTEFKQTDATIASEYGGTGLGLSITKKFVEMHGGRIWIESKLNRGSTFIFEVPLRVLQ
jgi:signal transduction histidine kinase/HAMP domain-containing protein